MVYKKIQIHQLKYRTDFHAITNTQYPSDTLHSRVDRRNKTDCSDLHPLSGHIYYNSLLSIVKPLLNPIVKFMLDAYFRNCICGTLTNAFSKSRGNLKEKCMRKEKAMEGGKF